MVRHRLMEKVHTEGGQHRTEQREERAGHRGSTAWHSCGPGRDTPRLWTRGLDIDQTVHLPSLSCSVNAPPQIPMEPWRRN